MKISIFDTFNFKLTLIQIGIIIGGAIAGKFLLPVFFGVVGCPILAMFEYEYMRKEV